MQHPSTIILHLITHTPIFSLIPSLSLSLSLCNQNFYLLSLEVWPEKNRQMSEKVAQKWFHSKMIDFDTFTKIA